jgi:transcriptional regulator with XRE-family HTH domain
MKQSSVEFAEDGDILSLAICGIRRKRGLKAVDVARRIGMALRSYELFEAGGGRLSVERIVAYADATDADLFALMLAPRFKSAEFAIDCADTKLVLILVMHLQDFHEMRGGDIAYLDPLQIIGAFDSVFRALGAKLDDHEAFLHKWLEGRTGSISLGALSFREAGRRKRRV